MCGSDEGPEWFAAKAAPTGQAFAVHFFDWLRSESRPMRNSFLLLILSLWPTVAVVADESQLSVAHPDWSPDGKQLAFESTWDGARNIYVMNVDGSRVRQLTFGGAMDTYPRYAPDGQWLVFLSRRQPLFSMHLIRADGKDERAFLPADCKLEPAFSPDGQWVAYRSYLGGDDADGEIMIVGVSGEKPRRVTENAVEDGYPVYSPDGHTLFFHRTVGDYRQIIRVDLATGAEIQLTKSNFNSWHAHPSPDGRNIVYDSDRDGNRNIYAMNLNSHQVAQLTTDPGRDEYPKFSPDGDRITFHSDRSGATEILIMDADGKGQVPVSPQWPKQK